MFYNLLLSNSRPVADWIATSFPIIRTVLIILITIFAVTIIFAVLLQPSKPAGGHNVILGTNESYYSHNKQFTKEGRLKKNIVFSAIVIFVLSVLYYLSFIPYRA